MPNTVKVPLLGTHKKGTVIGVAIGGVVVSGYMIWRYQKKNVAEQAAAQQAAAASAYGYSAYGYGHGVMPQGFFGYGEGNFGYGMPGFGVGGHFGYGTNPVTTPAPAITTNAQWAQAALGQLTSEGFQARTTAEALGAYELGREVTPAQQSIIQAAIGVEGEPPVPGPNDYPPKIRVSHGGQGGQGSGMVTVPAVEGKLYPAAASIIKAHHLVPEREGKATGRITHTNPPAGTRVKEGSVVKLSSFRRG